MTSSNDPISLTQKLIRFNTVNPPGQEHECAKFLAAILEESGFDVKSYDFEAGRTSLVARLNGNGGKPPLCFTGHIDTVPLGETPWHHDPFGAETDGDKLYGRGSTDMKGGVAAMVVAGLKLAKMGGRKAAITFVITAGEETGCTGATYLAGLDNVLGEAGAIVVGEPTSNELFVGHKGALWLEARTKGVAAHGSMPEEGENAIYKAAKAISQLESFSFAGVSHPILGRPTLSVGTISGGSKINIVPDKATIEIDIRIVPPQTGDQIMADLQSLLGGGVELTCTLNASAVASDPADQWIQDIFSLLDVPVTDSNNLRGATYFTDGSALAAAYGNPPTILLGPGEPEMCHKTDEYCYTAKIEEAAVMYLSIARHWCGV